MTLDNATVLANLQKQKDELEVQLENMRTTYYKVLGAIDALSQIEKANAVVEEETESEEEISDTVG